MDILSKKFIDLLGDEQSVMINLSNQEVDIVKKAKFRATMWKQGCLVDVSKISDKKITVIRTVEKPTTKPVTKKGKPVTKNRKQAVKATSPAAKKATSPAAKKATSPAAKKATSAEEAGDIDVDSGSHSHSYHSSSNMLTIIDIFNDQSSHIVYLVGPTQCGKSTDVRKVAELMGRKLYTVSCHSNMEYSELWGENDLTDDGNGNQTTVWKKGILEKACLEGLDENGDEVGQPAIVFIDEAPSMPADLAIGLNKFLESDSPVRELVINRDGGRVVKSHSGMRIIMAGNTALRGAQSDNEAMHSAQLDALDLSFVKRIFCCLRYGYNKSVEDSIVNEKIGTGPTNIAVKKEILQLRDEIRSQIRLGNLVTPFTTRDIIRICDAYRIFGRLSSAINFGLFGFLLAEERAVYNEIVLNQMGIDILASFNNEDEIDYMD